MIVNKYRVQEIRSMYPCIISNKRYSRLKRGIIYWKGEGDRSLVKELRTDFILGYIFPPDVNHADYIGIVKERKDVKLPAYYSHRCLPLVVRSIDVVEDFLDQLDSMTGSKHVFIISNVKKSGRLVSSPKILLLESIRGIYISLTFRRGIQAYIYSPSGPVWTQIFPTGSIIAAPVFPGEEEEYRSHLGGLMEGAL